MLPETSGTPLLDREASKPPKCYMDSEKDVVEWLLQPLSGTDREAFQSFELKEGKHAKARHKSFACSIMDLADDISFGIHDMEDALALRLVDQDSFRRHVTPKKCEGLLDYLNSNYAGKYGNDVYSGLIERIFADGAERKHQINRILNFVITSVEIEELPEFEETHFYLGRRHKLIVHESNVQPSEVKLLRGKLEVTLPVADRAAVRRRLGRWYEARANEYLRDKFSEIADRLSWIETRPPVKLMRMKTQWGSCSPGGMIYLNPALIRAPRHCIEYVILHELCHLVEHNHSKRFFDLLTKQMPAWENAKRELDSLAELILAGE